MKALLYWSMARLPVIVQSLAEECLTTENFSFAVELLGIPRQLRIQSVQPYLTEDISIWPRPLLYMKTALLRLLERPTD